MPWITTKSGKRINTDWFDEDAKRKYKQIEENKEQAKKLNGKPQTKEVTEEDIVKKIVGDESYTYDPYYKKLTKDASDTLDESREAEEKAKSLKEQLKSESRKKPADDWNADDMITAMAGEVPVTYTDKGKKIKAEYDAQYDKHRKATSKWHELTQELKEIDERNALIQRQWKQDYSGISSKLQDDYQGFDKNKSRTSYIDDMVKSGRAQIVEMPPELYLKEVAHKIFKKETLESTLRGTSVSNINKYMKMMQEGVKFDTPYLNYRDEQQEGRHRAIAAVMLGIKKIPVIIVRK